jgi:Zn-dependent protease
VNIDFAYVAMVLVAVFASMVLHELMHGLTAHALGDETAKHEGRLTLNPLKHIDPFLTILLPLMLAIFGMPIFGGAKPVPFRPDKVKGGEWGAALVGIVGPLTNLVLAFVCFAISWFAGLIAFQGNSLVYVNGVAAQFLVTGIMVNLGFFAFNILPIPPLDGSRVLYAIAPDGVRHAMEAIERMGLVIVFAIVLIFSSALSVILGDIIQFILRGFYWIFGIS